MKCVNYDGKMEYFKKSESTGWHENHWRCTECDYNEYENSRTDVAVLND